MRENDFMRLGRLRLPPAARPEPERGRRRTPMVSRACWAGGICLVVAGACHADERSLTLPQVIALAQANSPAAALAGHRYHSSYWQYRNARQAFLPVLTLDATAPDFTRSISRLTLPDGSEAFVSRSFATSSAQVSLRKTIGLTAGEVYLQSGLDRIDLLEGDRTTTYLSRPVSIGLRQPLFAFNPYRWQHHIEPLRFEEARRTYAEDLEGIAIIATAAFFDVLAVQVQVDNARSNHASADTLLALARRRLEKRSASEDEVTRAELAVLNARLEAMRSELEAEAQIRRLHAYLGIPDTTVLRLEIDYDVPDLLVSEDRALALAQGSRSDWVGFERRLLEAGREFAEARAGRGLRVNLFANYGFSESTTDPKDLFRRGQETQQASLGIEVPILDWGRWESRAALAESNWKVARITVERSREDFDQDVLIKVQQFNVQRERIRIATRADDLAQRHFDVARERYVGGQGDMTEVNLAQAEKDMARNSLGDALRGYWTSYYELRRATLYDFATQRPLGFDANPPAVPR